MSGDFIEKPQCVAEAANAKKGLHWSLELLVFLAVFLVSQFAMAAVMMPVQFIVLFANQELSAAYIKAVAANDMEALTSVSMQLASSHGYMISALVADSIMILMVCLFCKLIQKRKMTSLGFYKKGMVREYLIGAVVGFGIFSIAVLGSVLAGALKIEGISTTFSIGIFLLYLLGFMIQGMAEEVVCRGYFMVSFARRYPMYLAVLANSLGFAAFHLLNSGITVLSFVNLTLFGVFASMYFIRRGNIWGIGALHSIWNLVQGNFYGIRVSGMSVKNSLFTSVSVEGKELFNGGAFGLEGSIVVTLVLTAGIVILYFMKGKDRQQ